MNKQIAKLEKSLATQEAHLERMVAKDPTSPSVKAAKRIVFVFRAELAHLKAGNTAESFDLNAASAAAREAVR
jgi:hypothetical protein